jgi:hypothetical protein
MMPEDPFSLASDTVTIVVDPGRGADVLTITHIASDTQILFATPWRERADELRSGVRQPGSSDSVMSWMEHYRGGWQTLFPSAGEPRVIAGASVGFHGEVSITKWNVDERSDSSATLSVELFTVPVRIERRVSVEGSTVIITDQLDNLSSTTIEADYVSHPAFGGDLLNGTCRLDTGARRFSADPSFEHGTVTAWPWLDQQDGRRDLRELPPVGETSSAFGWLGDFESGWASVTNLDRGVRARLDWDSAQLPYAWVWQEFNSAPTFPWFGRARVLAIEPASTQTGGEDRASVFRLEPHETRRMDVRLTVDDQSGFTPGEGPRSSEREN